MLTSVQSVRCDPILQLIVHFRRALSDKNSNRLREAFREPNRSRPNVAHSNNRPHQRSHQPPPRVSQPKRSSVDNHHHTINRSSSLDHSSEIDCVQRVSKMSPAYIQIIGTAHDLSPSVFFFTEHRRYYSTPYLQLQIHEFHLIDIII
jgi:hypothetical protein